MTDAENLIDWRTEEFVKVAPKLEDAEKRLKAPLHKLFQRWVTEEHVAGNAISKKLDVSYQTVQKLITFFELDDEFTANKEAYRKSLNTKSFRVKPHRRDLNV